MTNTTALTTTYVSGGHYLLPPSLDQCKVECAGYGSQFHVDLSQVLSFKLSLDPIEEVLQQLGFVATCQLHLRHLQNRQKQQSGRTGLQQVMIMYS